MAGKSRAGWGSLMGGYSGRSVRFGRKGELFLPHGVHRCRESHGNARQGLTGVQGEGERGKAGGSGEYFGRIEELGGNGGWQGVWVELGDDTREKLAAHRVRDTRTGLGIESQGIGKGEGLG